jgi:hypothetical protein
VSFRSNTRPIRSIGLFRQQGRGLRYFDASPLMGPL